VKRAETKHDQECAACEPEHPSDRLDVKQRCRSRRTARREDTVDERDPCANRQADAPSGSQRRADQEQRHRAKL
jgi:hypothetical protein